MSTTDESARTPLDQAETRPAVNRADVARIAGVAESTVSRALNDSPRISEMVKERVRDVAVELGYIRNRQAVLLARNRTMRLGLVVPAYKNFGPFGRAYFPRLLDGTLPRAEQLQYSVQLVLDRTGDTYKDLSTLVKGKEVDGLLFSVTPIDDSRFDALKGEDIPFALLNNYNEKFLCVNAKPEIGMRDAFRHLCVLGHRRFAYIAGDQAYWEGRTRQEVFKKLAKEFDIDSRILEGDFSKTCGKDAATLLLEGSDRPEAIMCASDRTALGVMDYCRKRGMEVPRDVSVIGFDNLGPARDASPGLTTVHNPIVKMATDAVDLLVRRVENEPIAEEHIFVDSAFIIRESTGIPYTAR